MLVEFSAESSTGREELAGFLGIRAPDSNTDPAVFFKEALAEVQKFRSEVWDEILSL